MKRFHVNLSVGDLADSIRFYSALFGAEPSVRKDDYAKWLLEDPRINFAISRRGHPVGINHLGVQVESAEELTGMRAQLTRADRALVEQRGAACCYANSDKYWITDPDGVAWETFHTLAAIPLYGDDTAVVPQAATCCVPLAPTSGDACCDPAATAGAACCN